MKRCSKSLITREMLIKTTMRYHLIPIRMAIIKEITLARSWRKTFALFVVMCKLVQPLWKTVWRFLKKLKIDLLYDPAIPLLGTYPKKMKTLTQKDIHISIFPAASFTTAKIWKQSNCPLIDEWIKKLWYTNTMEHYLAIKKKYEMLPFTSTCMDLEGIMLK